MPKTIRSRSRLAFAFLTLVFLVFAGTAVERLERLHATNLDIQQRWLPRAIAFGQLNTLTSDLRIAELRHIVSTSDAERAALDAEIASLILAIDQQRAAVGTDFRREEVRQNFMDFERHYADYRLATDRALELSRRGERDAALAMVDDNGARFRLHSDALDRLSRLMRDGSAVAAAQAEALVENAKLRLAVAVPVVLLAILGAMILLERQVSTPLRAIADRMKLLPAGRLEEFTIPERTRPDEVGEVAAAVAETVEAVRRLAADLALLVRGVRVGVLSTRADPSAHRGDYAELVDGMNDLVEGLSRPLHEVAEVMQRVAGGDLKGRMAGGYEGDLRALKANLNRSLDSIVGLLGEVTAVARELADGDLTRSVEELYKGDFAHLKTNLNRALEQMRALLRDVANNMARVSVATTQTAAAARQVAEGAAVQLDTLVGVAGAVTETAAAVRDVSANAERGSAVARATAELAQRGQGELGRLVETIDTIAASQGRIERIVAKIARIADKTHVLSLNAGIEAARAGEQGLGFGIVAQEIGRLAEDAATAAREVETIIGDVTDLVQRSVTAAADARTAVDRMADAATESGGAAQAIAAAIAEQSATARHLSDQTERLKASSHDNATAAEEIGASMEELARIVRTTEAEVGRFRLA